jgi:hypothetical protein
MKQTPVVIPKRQDLQLDPDLALKGYTKDPDWMFKTGLGGTINAASVLLAVTGSQNMVALPVAIILASLSAGFVLRTTKMRLHNTESRLTEWNKWGDLFFSGIIWLAIQFCFLTVAAGFITSGVMIAYVAVTKGQASTFILGELLLFYTIAILAWTSLFSSYLMLNFAHEQRLMSGFALRKVVKTIRANPKTMLTAWLLSIAIQAFSIVATATTVIGIFLLPSVFFAAQLVGTTILTQAWRATLPQDFPP